MTERCEMGNIQVPKYFSDIFNRKLSSEEQASKRIRAMVERTHKLIAVALEDLSNADWEIANTNYHSCVVNEPMGLEGDGVMTYVYGEERGKRTPIAIFKGSTLAADYFVWLVSQGKREINWELFLDMVPE